MKVGLDSVQPVRFVWSRPAAGFHWEEIQDLGPPPPALPWLHPDPPRTVLFFSLPLEGIDYQPLEDTERNEEGILGFANKYGSLDKDASDLAERKKRFDDMPPITSGPTRGLYEIHRERYSNGVRDRELGYWQEEILEMSTITTLFEYWQDQDKKRLREFCIKNLPEMEFRSFWVGDEEQIRDHIRRHRDIVWVAQILLVSWVNAKFEERFSTTIRPKLSVNERKEVESYLEPKSLLDAMWLQLYEAIIGASQGENRVKRCEVCGKPEMLWLHGERRHNSDWKKHTACYNAQKQKDYRDRKRQQKAASKKGE
jgi:hypothetical protein